MKPPSNVHNNTVSADEWTLDVRDLEALVTPKTKMLVSVIHTMNQVPIFETMNANPGVRFSILRVLHSPLHTLQSIGSILMNHSHNPTGKIFSSAELHALGTFCTRHSLILLSDEVYHRLSFIPYPRLQSSSDEIWSHTLTVGSIGKSFNATGWRVGYVIGPERFIESVLLAHTLLAYTTAGPAQKAAALGLMRAEEEGFWYDLSCLFVHYLDQIDPGRCVATPFGMRHFLEICYKIVYTCSFLPSSKEHTGVY